MFGLVILATSVWMAYDAAQIGYDKRDVQGLAAISPAAWLVAGLLLWIVAFPVYLIKRPALKAAAEWRRQQLALGPGAYGQLYRPQYGQPQYGQPQYGQPQYGQPQHGQQQHGQQQYGQPQQPDIAEEIRKLGELRVSGLLTEEEFQQKKADLLSRMY